MCAWCETVFEWIWEEFWSSVWRWVTDTIRRCNRRRCRWICACCNRWLCWIAAVLVAIVAFIVALILTLVAIVVCAICYILCIALCILGILFGNTETDACIEAWCQGLPRESDEERPVDPQKPGEPGPPGGVDPGGALSGGGVVRSSQAIVIDGAPKLQELDSWRRVLGGPSHVLLRLPRLSEKETKRWQTKLNHELSACGCSEGAVFMAIGVAGYAIVLPISSAAQPLMQWSNVGTGLAVAAVAGLIGKAFGIVRARRRLSRLIHELEDAVTP